MNIQFKLDNRDVVAHIERALKNSPDVAERLMMDACLLVEGDAKAKCPVDSGTLAGSIKSDTDMEGTQAVGYVHTDIEYAPYVHDGTSKMAGRPFLQQAINKNKDNIVRVFADYFNLTI